MGIIATPVIVATETTAGATVLSSQINIGSSVLERGIGTLASGKATITASTATVNSYIVLQSLASEAERANSMLSVIAREAGQFKVCNSTLAGTPKFVWAILA